MEKYDYRQSMIEDIKDYLNDNYTPEELSSKGSKDELFDDLYEELWTADSVTGNASGSYTCNRWKAEEHVCHNWDLLSDAIWEFGLIDNNVIQKGAEWCDVTIRCYLLSECLREVLEDIQIDSDSDNS